MLWAIRTLASVLFACVVSYTVLCIVGMLQAEDDSPCDYLVELDDRTSDSDTRALRGDKSHWKALKEVPYLDASRSPAVYRAFLIPGVSRERVVFGKYKLLERVPSVPAEPDIDIELDTLRRYA